MARTIHVSGPAGLTLPGLRLVSSTDALADTITLTESVNALGRYNGTLTASSGTYTAVLLSDTNAVGTFAAVVVTGIDPEQVEVHDTTTAERVEQIGVEYRHTNLLSGAGFDDVVISEVP